MAIKSVGQAPQFCVAPRSLDDIVQEWLRENQDFPVPIKEQIRDRIQEFLSDPDTDTLSFEGLELTSLPQFLSHPNIVSKLRKLDLTNNDFTQLPPVLFTLSNLTQLILAEMPNLNSFPDEIAQLAQLEEVDIYLGFDPDSQRFPFRFPASFFSMPLKKLIIGYRDIQSDLPNIARMTHLEDILLEYCGLNHFPVCLTSSLRNLRSLNLAHNHIEQLPAETISPSVTQIDLTSNPIRGIHPRLFSPFGTRITIELSFADLQDVPEAQVLAVGISRDDGMRLARKISQVGYQGVVFTIQDQPITTEIVDAVFPDLAFHNLMSNLFEISRTRMPENLNDVIDADGKLLIENVIFALRDHLPTSHTFARPLYTLFAEALSFACQDKDYRDLFFPLIIDAASTCGDRMILNFLMLGFKRREALLDPKDERAVFTFARAQFILNFLEKCSLLMVEILEKRANDDEDAFDRVPENPIHEIIFNQLTFPAPKVIHHNHIDPVEILLVLPVKLNSRLDLQLDFPQMLFRDHAAFSDESIEAIAKHIDLMMSQMGELEKPAGFIQFLKNYRLWTQFLEIKYPKELEAGISALIEGENTEIYFEKIVELTRKELESSLTGVELDRVKRKK